MLALAVVILLPEMVAATLYVKGPTSGTLAADYSNQIVSSCGLEKTSLTDSSVTFSNIGPVGSPLASTSSSASFNALETGGVGGAGYQYLVGEADLACINVPLSATAMTLGVELCGIGANAPTVSVSTSGLVTFVACGGTTESSINDDWVVTDVALGGPGGLNSADPVTTSGENVCGTNNGGLSGGSATTLYGDLVSSPDHEQVFADNPSGTPSGATNYALEGPLTSGSCSLASLSLPYTVEAGGSGLGKVQLTAIGTQGSCSGTSACGYDLTFTDTCTAAQTSGTTCGEDYFLTISFALVDEGTSGLDICSSGACTLGTSNGFGSPQSIFYLGWAN